MSVAKSGAAHQWLAVSRIARRSIRATSLPRGYGELLLLTRRRPSLRDQMLHLLNAPTAIGAGLQLRADLGDPAAPLPHAFENRRATVTQAWPATSPPPSLLLTFF